MASTTASGVPSSKEKKYDRQLRLWGADGQNKLESAHIALFGASATGCETLKNLILPSVGKFTIIDDKKVVDADLGVNFFLDEDSIGKSRAERTAALLGELNPDVRGGYIEDNLSNLLATKPELFRPESSPFTHIVVVSPFLTSDVLKLSPEIPTFLAYSIGFTCSLRIAAPTRCIVDTHPDTLIDLRLLNPWEELSALVADLGTGVDAAENDGGMSDHKHGHVPYVVLLLKYLEEWRATHGGANPLTYKEKTDFKAMILDRMRTNVPGGSEENYEEAAAAVLKNVREAELSSDTRGVLEDPRCINPSKNSFNFWIIAHAVREFQSRANQGAGLLPLSGGFPDMKAESSTYVALQTLYRSRARRDALLVLENTQSILAALGRDPESISLEEITLFAKHANFVRKIDYRPLAPEYTQDDHHKHAVTAALAGFNPDWNKSTIHEYVAVRAWQAFYDRHGRAAGDEDSTLEADVVEMLKIAEEYLKEVGYEGEMNEHAQNTIKEVVRAGGGELHAIASLAGGIVAQEIVKVITSQYVPINNTVVFDGIASRSSTFGF